MRTASPASGLDVIGVTPASPNNLRWVFVAWGGIGAVRPARACGFKSLLRHCENDGKQWGSRSGRPERGPRGCDRGRQDRGATPVGLRSVPLGGPGWGLFAGGSWWREGAEGHEGAGGELSGVLCEHQTTTGRAPCDAQPGCESSMDDPFVQAARVGACRCRRRRHTCQPPQASPARAMAYVEGSGTTTRSPVLVENTSR